MVLWVCVMPYKVINTHMIVGKTHNLHTKLIPTLTVNMQILTVFVMSVNSKRVTQLKMCHYKDN